MKKLAILAVSALAIVSCKNEAPKQDLMMTQLRDSLNTIIAQKDTEINDMIATYKNNTDLSAQQEFLISAFKTHYKIA